MFQYDANGNLMGQGNVYDTQLSFLRTNKIWMFLACNYSINNNFQASAYNTSKLPLLFACNYLLLSFIRQNHLERFLPVGMPKNIICLDDLG